MKRTDEQDVRDAKTQLRTVAKARRAALAPDDRQLDAEAVAHHGLGFLGLRPQVVSGFLAIGDEIDPALLLERLLQEGSALALPVMVGKGQPLEFRAWTPGDDLETVTWGIQQPRAGMPVVAPDVLLVPLLAFDRRGYRLGYGGGYYDRTLGDLRRRRPIVAVGLAFGSQEVDAVPHLDYDERLDWVLTPEGPIRCQS